VETGMNSLEFTYVMLDDAITMSHRISWNFTSPLLLSIKYANFWR